LVNVNFQNPYVYTIPIPCININYSFKKITFNIKPMVNYSYKMFGPDPDFDEENSTPEERAQEWWGDPDVNPNTGRPYEDD
jgi:hypothetical protein